MRKATTATALATPLFDWASTSDINSVYKWLGDDAVLAYGNSAPAEYTEIEKQRRDRSASSVTYQTVDENIMRRDQRIELIESRPESPRCMCEKIKLHRYRSVY
jgi:hypothetical protein